MIARTHLTQSEAYKCNPDHKCTKSLLQHTYDVFKMSSTVKAHTDQQKWFRRTFLYTFFQDFPGSFMSIFHVSPGLFNQVDIEQVKFSYKFTK